MVVVNQTLNPKVKAEVLTTANSSVVLVADEPPANATKHFWQIVESAPDATLENAGSNETMAHNLREGINKFKWVLQNDDCADAVDVTVTRTTVPHIPTPELRDGFYQLATTENFYWFVDQVNSGNTKINAMLIKDIVINADCLSHLSLSKKDNEEFDIVEWQPIGTPDNPYGGTFNGGGYSISGLYINSDTDDNVGLFDTVGEDGTVKNVGVEDSYIKGDENVGAICGNNQGTILNCYNTSIVQGNENVGAITGALTKSGEVAKSLVEGAPSEFVLEVFNLDNVLPGVDHITAPGNSDNPPTPVREVSGRDVRIWSFSNIIVVDNADENIFVITSSGVTTKIVSPESSRTEIRILNSGIYIVKTGKVSQRVLIQ